MPTYSTRGPDGRIYTFEGPSGISPRQLEIAVSRQLLAEQQRAAQEAEAQRVRNLPPPAPERTVLGNTAELLKGLIPGAVGLAETAGVGISALLPEQMEKSARAGIAEIAGVLKAPFAAAPGYEESVTRRLSEGLGSTLPFFALGPLGLLGRLAGTGIGAAAGAGEARLGAESKGATESERATATALGAPTGLLDMLAPYVPAMKSMVTTALARGGVEGATEAAQKIAQNLIAKGVYNPSQPILEGSGEEGAYGAGVGALASLIIDTTIGRKARRADLERQGLAAPETPPATPLAGAPVPPGQRPLFTEPDAEGKLPPPPGSAEPATPSGATPASVPTPVDPFAPYVGVEDPAIIKSAEELLDANVAGNAADAIDKARSNAVVEETTPTTTAPTTATTVPTDVTEPPTEPASTTVTAPAIQPGANVTPPKKESLQDVIDRVTGTFGKELDARAKLADGYVGTLSPAVYEEEMNAVDAKINSYKKPPRGKEDLARFEELKLISQRLNGLMTSAKEREEKAAAAAPTTPTTTPAPAPTPEPTTTAAAAAAVPTTPTTPVSSFTTAKGSTYEVTESGQTVRTKRSEGRGQGETYPPHTAFYVQPGDHTNILSDMQGGMGNNSVRLGYVKDNTFTPVSNVQEIPEGIQPVVGVFDKESNKVVGMYTAQTTPAVGLHPVEKLYNSDGTSSTHVGNQIVSINAAAAPTPTAATPAEKRTVKETKTKYRVTFDGKPATLTIIRNVDSPDRIDGVTIKVDGERLPWLNLGKQGVVSDQKMLDNLVEIDVIDAKEEPSATQKTKPTPAPTTAPTPVSETETRVNRIKKRLNELDEYGQIDADEFADFTSRLITDADNPDAIAEVESSVNKQWKQAQDTIRELKNRRAAINEDLARASREERERVAQERRAEEAGKSAETRTTKTQEQNEADIADIKRREKEKSGKTKGRLASLSTFLRNHSKVKTPGLVKKLYDLVTEALSTSKTPDWVKEKFGFYHALNKIDPREAVRNLEGDLVLHLYGRMERVKSAKKFNEAMDDLMASLRSASTPEEFANILFPKNARGELDIRSTDTFYPGAGGKFMYNFYNSLSNDTRDKLNSNLVTELAYTRDIENMTWRRLSDEIARQKRFDADLDRIVGQIDTRESVDKQDALDLPARYSIFSSVHPSVEYALAAGDLKAALTALANTTSGRTSRIAQVFAAKLGNTKIVLDPDIKGADGLPAAGQYDPNTDTLKINPRLGVNNHTILHETAHALTNTTLNNPSHPVTQQLNKLFTAVENSLETAYGRRSIKEFLSEAMSNSEFQRMLSQITVDGGKVNAWSRFKNVIQNMVRRMLGMQPKRLDSALDAVDQLVLDIIAPGSDALGTGILYETSLAQATGGVFSALDQKIKMLKPMNNVQVRGIYSFLTQRGPAAAKKAVLYGLNLDSLVEVAKPLFPMAPQLNLLSSKMDGSIDKDMEGIRATMQRITTVLAKPIDAGKSALYAADQEAALCDIINESSVEEVDPSQPRGNYVGKVSKSGKHKEEVWDYLNSKFNKLTPEVQSLYGQMRDTYTQFHDRVIKLLTTRITESVADPVEAKKLVTEIEQRLIAKGRIEPYFALWRQGDYWVEYTAKSATGNMEYYKTAFEDPVERDQFMLYLRSLPSDQVQVGSVQKSAPSAKRDMDRIPPTAFVNNIMKVLSANQAPPNVVQEVMRLYLDVLPESSYAQSFRERKGTLGFDTRAIRVFYSKTSSLAHQLANMEYAPKLYALQEEMKKHYIANNNTEEAQRLYDAMAKHIDTIVTPRIGPISKALTSTAFFYTLGFNVSSVLVNTTQLPMVVVPALGAEYGYSKTNSAMGFATRMFFHSGLSRKVRMSGRYKDAAGTEMDYGYIDLKTPYSIDNYDFTDPNLAPKIKKMGVLAEMMKDQGMLSRTITSDIVEQYAPDTMLGKVNHWSGALFHHGERMTRQIAATAAYKLELDKREAAKGSALTEDEMRSVAQQAIDRMVMLNGGASANSAPIIAKNGAGKVLMMYKRYGVAMYYYLFKTAKAMYANETDPLVRAAAKRQIAGIFGMSALLAGVQGVPMFGIAAAIYNLFAREDDEDDFETAMRKYLGEGMFNGGLNYLTGTAIASRVGLSDLLINSTNYKEQDNVMLSFMQLVGGPVYGVADRITRGIGLIADGQTRRGLEQVAPASFANLSKAERFYSEGATTLRGDPITGDIAPGHILAQVFGFTPAEYLRQLEENTAVKGIDKAVMTKRSELLRKYYVAMRMGDIEEARGYGAELLAMNIKRPGIVTADTFANSMAQHARTSATMRGGITISPSMRNYLIQDLREFDRDSSIFADTE